LSVSSKGELAILTGARYISHRLFLGTLARMPIGGGAPREILEHVREADWAPDGNSLAIIRDVDGRDRLEYPIGKVLYEASGYLSDPRVSPSGDRVAFFEHPVKYDDRGGVAVVEPTGKKTTLTEGYWGLEGSAWSPDGRELMFSAGLSYAQFKIFGVNMSGTVRQIVESAGGLTLYDRAADGRWLAARDDIGFVMMAKPPGATDEVNLSWLDFSQANKLSGDGRVLLFTEQSGVVGNNYAVCLRKTDGSPVVRLGEGGAYDLSPDGKWALAAITGTPNQLMIYPTGAGESRRLPSGPIVQYSSGRWFPDGRRVIVCGSEAGRSDRCYVQDVNGGAPSAVTPDDTHGGFVSPDGAAVLVRRGGGAARDASHGATGSTVFEIYPFGSGGNSLCALTYQTYQPY
jgi:Tol biopolymer transport system component